MRSAFSLVETLVVLGILSILLALSAPSIISVQQSYEKRRALSTIASHLDWARVEALTTGELTSVRFQDNKVAIFRDEEQISRWKDLGNVDFGPSGIFEQELPQFVFNGRGGLHAPLQNPRVVIIQNDRISVITVSRFTGRFDVVLME